MHRKKEMISMTTMAIKTENLTKRYGEKVAVDGLSFEVADGETVSLLGVNGAGKTTTIKMLSCLTPVTSGEAYMKGYDVRKESFEVKKIINVSPQETAVAKKLSVRENLGLISEIYGKKSDEAKKCVSNMINALGLNEVADKKAGILSGGYQRKVSIAMALITEPEILFLDEPTLGLDVIARRELWNFISSLKGKITIVLTTHYLEEAENLSDKVAVMSGGRLVAFESPEKIKQIANADNFEEAFIRLSTQVEIK